MFGGFSFLPWATTGSGALYSESRYEQSKIARPRERFVFLLENHSDCFGIL